MRVKDSATYVSNNTVSSAEVAALISQVHSHMRVSHGKAVAALTEPLKPAVSIKRSITPEYLVCLEDGKKFKIAETPPAHPVPDDAGSISREVELAG